MLCGVCEGRPPGAVIEIDAYGYCVSCQKPVGRQGAAAIMDGGFVTEWEEYEWKDHRRKYAMSALRALLSARPIPLYEEAVSHAWGIADMMIAEEKQRG